jgi:LPS sulfotransferase NodH
MNDAKRKYLFIASEVRSGSTYIAESLSYELDRNFGFGTWDLGKERFSQLDKNSTSDDILMILNQLHLDKKSGFSYSKLMCKSLAFIHRAACKSDDIRQAFFGNNCYWIVVRRRDRIKQAVSLAIARKTGNYHFYGDERAAPDNDVSVTLSDVENALRAVVLSDVYLDVFASTLQGSRVVNIYYEDFMVEEVKFLAQVHEMCGFDPIDADSHVNLSKLKPTGQESKRVAYEQYRNWLLANYV